MQYCLAGEIMDWIRKWVLQIVGVIVLSAVCDMIMIEGNMKKYVKPILGFILIFTMLRPVTALTAKELYFDVYNDNMYLSTEILNEAESMQRLNTIKMYEKKLADKIKEIIITNYNYDSKVEVSVEKNKKTIGDISNINITIFANDGEVVNTEGIKKFIAGEFGTKNNQINVVLK